MPKIRPTQSPIVRFLKNAPCPQSCWIKNTRTKNAPLKMEMPTAAQVLIASIHHARAQSAKNGTKVTISSKMLRERIGSRYFARIRVHSEGCKEPPFVTCQLEGKSDGKASVLGRSIQVPRGAALSPRVGASQVAGQMGVTLQPWRAAGFAQVTVPVGMDALLVILPASVRQVGSVNSRSRLKPFNGRQRSKVVTSRRLHGQDRGFWQVYNTVVRGRSCVGYQSAGPKCCSNSLGLWSGLTGPGNWRAYKSLEIGGSVRFCFWRHEVSKFGTRPIA